jgi:uncharacterized protein (TIRG00374 family)
MNKLNTRFNQIKGLVGSEQTAVRVWIQVLAILIALVCLFFSFKGIDWQNFWSTLKNGNYLLLPLVLLLSSGNYFLRALRWRTLISSQKNIGPLSAFWANMVGYLGNQLLPARAGEFLRAFYMGKKHGLSVAFVLATCFMERLSDVFALILIGVGCIFILGVTASSIINAMFIFLLVAIIGLGIVLFLPLLQTPLVNGLSRFGLFEKVRAPFEKLLNNLSAGFKVFKEARILVTFGLFTLVIWTLDGVGFCLAASMFHLQIDLIQALMTLVAMGLASAIPSTPGYVGVYQFVAVLVLVPLGFSQAAVLALITAVQVIGTVVVLLWGSIGILQFPTAQIAETQEEKSSTSV